MHKKFLTVFLVFIFVFAITGCADTSPDGWTPDGDTGSTNNIAATANTSTNALF